MSGIKDGISRALTSSDERDNSSMGLSEDQFLSIGELSNTGMNYHDVLTEAFYITPIWKWMVSDIDEMKKLIPILYEIKKENPEGNSRSNFGSWQSPDDLHIRPEFKNFVDMLLNIAEVQIQNQPWQCIGMWAGINPKGGGNNVHLHEGVLSGTVWLQVNTDLSGGLAFCDPRIRSKMSGQRGMTLFGTNNKGYHPVDGMGVLFPAWFEHFVLENKDDKDRISISFNLV
jgi:uncharacterized protein (TIGR02466 family)